MRILYGVQGTGNGHITRARKMSRALHEVGLEVDYLFTGRAPDAYFDMATFGDYRTFTGLTFNSANGKINPVKTLLESRPRQLFSDINQLNVQDYDLVLNDFEPVSAWAAKRKGVPTIGLSHQNAFRHQVPKVDFNMANALLMKCFAPTQHPIGVHWYHFGCPILPPIVDMLSSDQQVENKILVYLPFESLSQVVDLLRRFSTHQFYCYHPDAKNQQVENVTIRQLSREGFQQDLHDCAGVIANGGFELPSEAMQLGKKMLLKPLHGQFEQQSNVATLEMMGLATKMHGLEQAEVAAWLPTESAGKVRFPDVAKALALWIKGGREQPFQQLVDTLWCATVFPENVLDQLPEQGANKSASLAWDIALRG
ncbi:MJ1255/VC2487 family glycosyltransferase [Motilimonas eburnea]|uniref:MJ1255/VC2487 family glycosyltransferase n=1 Tax=Motilimonas eburnea TaxID=1737488 RepID=UPI001E3EC27F|nr:MJ1255/VC2487 family glycosyltransferase [Motilimonas eburnea]MCE2570843.1 glycosyltransferase [Motilimonas eburnea]